MSDLDDWRALARRELKGREPDSLTWETPEGIAVRPLYTGADLPFDLGETAKALRLMDTYDADIVAAYRFDRTGEGPRRFVYSYVYNSMVKAAFGVRVRDVNFSAKLIRREVLDAVSLRSEGSFVDVELLDLEGVSLDGLWDLGLLEQVEKG